MRRNDTSFPSYEAGNLREQISNLRGTEDFVLIPLLEVVFQEFLKKRNWPATVTDCQKVCGGWHDAPKYILVVDGKAVIVGACERDIDTEDDDESWTMAQRIYFEGDHQAARVLHREFQKFIVAQGLRLLMKKARAELRKGKTYHLHSSMSDFYFGNRRLISKSFQGRNS